MNKVGFSGKIENVLDFKDYFYVTLKENGVIFELKINKDTKDLNLFTAPMKAGMILSISGELEPVTILHSSLLYHVKVNRIKALFYPG